MNDKYNAFLEIENDLIMLESVKHTINHLIESELVYDEMKSILHGLSFNLKYSIDQITSKLRDDDERGE